MDNMKITGIELMSPPHQTTTGSEILAYFAADIGPVRVKGCALVKRPSGHIAAWLPNLHDKKARNNRSITLIEAETNEALLAAALQSYRRMGGKDAEPRGPIERAEVALASILPPPVIRREIPVTVIRRTKEQVE